MLRLRHDHFFHSDDETKSELAGIRRELMELKRAVTAQTKEVAHMAGELQALEAEVERNTTVDGSVITLVNGLAAQIEALKNDPAKLQAMADKLRADNDALAAAVTAHTPAEPPA
ncbi:MAG: hypothetical protein M3547_01090 [Acidobacteriota bacterium]|nr:hypothetical protein [Acidobacteriota bacterium]